MWPTCWSLRSAFRASLSLLDGSPISAVSPIAAGTDDAFDLREDEVEEQDRGGTTEDDDDPARGRTVRIVALTPEECKELSEQGVDSQLW